MAAAALAGLPGRDAARLRGLALPHVLSLPAPPSIPACRWTLQAVLFEQSHACTCLQSLHCSSKNKTGQSLTLRSSSMLVSISPLQGSSISISNCLTSPIAPLSAPVAAGLLAPIICSCAHGHRQHSNTHTTRFSPTTLGEMLPRHGKHNHGCPLENAYAIPHSPGQVLHCSHASNHRTDCPTIRPPSPLRDPY